MEWININDSTVDIPFSKVCIWDGGNTFWAYLQKIEISAQGRKVFFNIVGVPENYGSCEPLYWMKLTTPK